ncbi:MAG: hypothetical protein ACTS3F_12750 [Phycisphaerales bacterium]
MTPPVLFRIGMRLVGLLIIGGFAVPMIIEYAGFYISANYHQHLPGMQYTPVDVLISVISCAAILAIGLYLLFGGKALSDALVRRVRRYCPECDFDLVGTTTTVCPECGLDLPPGTIAARDRLSINRALTEQTRARAAGTPVPEPWRSVLAHHQPANTNPPAAPEQA